MREYFWNLLVDLDKLAGLKQLDKIYAAHPDDEKSAKEEINKVLDACCNASALFPFIPEEDQQKIITHCVITEEFHSLNAATIYKWLVRQKDRYFKESHHIEKPSEPPLTGEARQKKLDEWLRIVNETPVGHGVEPLKDHELMNEKRKMRSTIEWLKEKPKDYEPHRKTSAEVLNAHDLHLQWIRENHDAISGKKLQTWQSEEEWLKSRKS